MAALLGMLNTEHSNMNVIDGGSCKYICQTSSNNNRNGFGLYIKGGKPCYIGFWKDNNYDGLGIYSHNDTYIYIGY